MDGCEVWEDFRGGSRIQNRVGREGKLGCEKRGWRKKKNQLDGV